MRAAQTRTDTTTRGNRMEVDKVRALTKTCYYAKESLADMVYTSVEMLTCLAKLRMEVDKEKSAQLEQELEQYCDKIVSDYLNLGVAINETFSSLRRKSGGNYSV